MTEKDKIIQDLRRENERLRKWVDELEEKIERLEGMDYCDRNKCLQMEYNGKGCAECEVTGG